MVRMLLLLVSAALFWLNSSAPAAELPILQSSGDQAGGEVLRRVRRLVPDTPR